MVSSFNVNPAAFAEIEALATRYRDGLLEDIAADAQRYAPVRTGELRASIHANPADGTVVAGADYAAYVELGTEDTPAQPFLRRALYQKRDPRPGRGA